MPKIIVEVPVRCADCMFLKRDINYLYGDLDGWYCIVHNFMIDNFEPCQQCLDARAEAENILEPGKVK